MIIKVPTGTGVAFSGGVTQTNNPTPTHNIYTVTATTNTSQTVTLT